MTAQEPVIILVPAERVRAWVLELADALRASLPVPVSLRRLAGVSSPAALPFEALERWLCGPPPAPIGEWISTTDMPPAETCGAASLVISAVECSPRELDERLPMCSVLVPTFEEGYRLDAVFAALVEDRSPVVGVEVLCGTEVRRLFAAEVAIPAGKLFSRSVVALLARVILCLQRAARWACFTLLVGACASATMLDLGSLFFVFAGLACGGPALLPATRPVQADSAAAIPAGYSRSIS